MVGPIGFLDSGVGGLTILSEVQKSLPQYDMLYFGDSLHAPYGSKTEEELYKLVEQGTRWLFAQGCPLVIYACNTASATVLREIQQQLVPQFPGRRVLGIVRPTIEEITRTGHKNILVLATQATVNSGAYEKELEKIDPTITITSHACPTWAQLVEQGKAQSEEAAHEVARELTAARIDIHNYDAVLLACTHYPYLSPLIAAHLKPGTDLYNQGELVAQSLADYLKRHTEIDVELEKQKRRRYTATGDASHATELATRAFGYSMQFEHVDLDS